MMRSRPRPAGHPKLWRPAGGLTDDEVNRTAAQQGLAAILWDVIPFDWMNDANTSATRYMLMSQVKPGSVVLFHDTYSSTVDVVYQFLPVLKANGYHLVTVSQLLGPRAPGSVYGGRDNGPPVNDLTDIPPAEIPTLAEHAVSQADAQLPDHRYARPEFGRTEQRRLAFAQASSATFAIASTSSRLSSSSSVSLSPISPRSMTVWRMVLCSLSACFATAAASS